MMAWPAASIAANGSAAGGAVTGGGAVGGAICSGGGAFGCGWLHAAATVRRPHAKAKTRNLFDAPSQYGGRLIRGRWQFQLVVTSHCQARRCYRGGCEHSR